MREGFQSRSRYRLLTPTLELSKESAIIVARKQDSHEMVGIVEIYPQEEVYLCNLAVCRSMRRQGIARELCRACERVALHAWGRRSIGLTVERSNAAAIRLYESLGYVTQSNKRHASWEDMLLGNINLLSFSKVIQL
jgi:ribosomal protein S18 acetylase RimI-like enzyme